MAQGYDAGRRGSLWVKRTLIAAAIGAAATTGVAMTASTAFAQTAPAAPAATIHPGVMTMTDGAQCTANFIFTNGNDTLIGQAAHCSGTGSDTDTNGCTSNSLPIGTPVTIGGASKPGTLVYNSWLTMKAAGETNADACEHNDLALVKIDPADVAKVSSTVPALGGPKGIDVDGTRPGDQVTTYGNSKLRGGVSVLSPKTGVSTGDSAGGWTHTILTVSPGIPGDSGSGVLSGGNALGVLSTINIAPSTGTNGVSDLNKMLAYANAHNFNAALKLG